MVLRVQRSGSRFSMHLGSYPIRTWRHPKLPKGCSTDSPGAKVRLNFNHELPLFEFDQVGPGFDQIRVDSARVRPCLTGLGQNLSSVGPSFSMFCLTRAKVRQG